MRGVVQFEVQVAADITKKYVGGGACSIHTAKEATKS